MWISHVERGDGNRQWVPIRGYPINTIPDGVCFNFFNKWIHKGVPMFKFFKILFSLIFARKYSFTINLNTKHVFIAENLEDIPLRVKNFIKENPNLVEYENTINNWLTLKIREKAAEDGDDA